MAGLGDTGLTPDLGPGLSRPGREATSQDAPAGRRRQEPQMSPEDLARKFTEMQSGTLPGELGMVWEAVETGRAQGRLAVEARHMAPNGYLHAASVIALVDTASGYGCRASLPDGASGFTTLELKSNFLGTARPGDVVGCEARLVHGGRQTQVWDAEAVNRTSGKTMALFRCTQLVLYPR
jgi:uncharacterized protein (TIGR00369 family)